MWTHNSIVSAWSDCLSDLLILHQVEPRQRFVDNENQTDITLYDTNTGGATTSLKVQPEKVVMQQLNEKQQSQKILRGIASRWI